MRQFSEAMSVSESLCWVMSVSGSSFAPPDFRSQEISKIALPAKRSATQNLLCIVGRFTRRVGYRPSRTVVEPEIQPHFTV